MDEFFEYKCKECFKQDFRKDDFSLPCRSCGSSVRKVSQVPRLYPTNADRPVDRVVYVSPTPEPPYYKIFTSERGELGGTNIKLSPDDAA